MKASSISIVVFLALTAGSCKAGPVRKVKFFKASDMATYQINRVVVLPFANAVQDPELDISSLLGEAFVRELRKRSPYEVIELSSDTVKELHLPDPSKSGEYPAEALISIGKRYRADGIVFGNVTTLRPYYPQALGARIEMVSTETGTTLWFVDALYDASDQDVENAVQRHYKMELSHYTDTDDWRTIMVSPTRFAGFVAAQCTQALWHPEPKQAKPPLVGPYEAINR